MHVNIAYQRQHLKQSEFSVAMSMVHIAALRRPSTSALDHRWVETQSQQRCLVPQNRCQSDELCLDEKRSCCWFGNFVNKEKNKINKHKNKYNKITKRRFIICF